MPDTLQEMYDQGWDNFITWAKDSSSKVSLDCDLGTEFGVRLRQIAHDKAGGAALKSAYAWGWRANKPYREELQQRVTDYERIKQQAIVYEHETQQILGKALGFPWFKDDQKNFPGATEADGVCVGEHVAVTLAQEAADEIAKLRRQIESMMRNGLVLPVTPTSAASDAPLRVVGLMCPEPTGGFYDQPSVSSGSEHA